MQPLSYSSSQAHASRDQIVVTRRLNGCQHAKLACSDEVNKIRNQRLKVRVVLVTKGVGVGGLIAKRCAGSSCSCSHCD
jgi:hypothetical protein